MKTKNKMFSKLKERWPVIRERIENASKFILMTITMIMGMWVIYTMLWMALGFPVTRTAMYLLFAQSMISEYMYIKWLSK